MKEVRQGNLIVGRFETHTASISRGVYSSHHCASYITMHPAFGKCPTERRFAAPNASYTAVSVGQHPSVVCGMTFNLLAFIDIHPTTFGVVPKCYIVLYRRILVAGVQRREDIVLTYVLRFNP